MSRLRAEDGFGILELLMSMTVLVVGVLAIVSTFDASRGLVTVAERQSTATARAEREVERLRSLAYTSLAQRANVSLSADVTLPANYVPAGVQVVDTVTGVQQQTWSDGRTSGTVDVYVAWVDDPCCAGAQNYKRVVVAIKLDGVSGPKRPVVLTTNMRTRPGL